MVCCLSLILNLKLLHAFANFFPIQGDVNYVTVVGQPIIILNSYQAARDLLEKRSGIYSSRPRMVMLTELYVHHCSPGSSDSRTFITTTLLS